MWWIKYWCINFKQEIGSFHFFYHFFYHFFLFFQNLLSLPILRTPMGHPSSPMTPICSFMSPGPNQSMDDITDGYYWWILEFFSETSIFPFLAILTPGDPPIWPSPYRRGLWGTLLWTPGSSLDPTTTQKKNASWIGSPTPVLGHLKGSSMRVTKGAKISIP